MLHFLYNARFSQTNQILYFTEPPNYSYHFITTFLAIKMSITLSQVNIFIICSDSHKATFKNARYARICILLLFHSIRCVFCYYVKHICFPPYYISFFVFKNMLINFNRSIFVPH